MKKVASEIALTVVSPFAILLFGAISLAYVSLFAGCIGIILPLAAWIDQTIDTTTLLIYSAVFGSLLALGKYWEDLLLVDFIEKALKRGLYAFPLLGIGGLVVAGIVINFF
jgi:hypothetical protein